MDWFRQPGVITRFVLALLATVVVYEVFIPPSIGVADNGDFGRVMTHFGLQHAAPSYEDRYFNYLDRLYTIAPASPIWSPEALLGGFQSSENLLLASALSLHRFLGKDALVFDIRYLGAIHAALFLLAAVVLMAALRRRSLQTRIIAGVFALGVFADSAYIAYFNSMYSEPAVLCFLMLSLALAVWLIETDGFGETRLVLAFIASVFLLAVTKHQYLLFSLSAIPVAVCAWRARRRLAAAAGCAAALAGCGVYATHIPAGMREAYYYNVVFAEISQKSGDARQALRSLGLDPDLAYLKATHAYQEGVDYLSPELQQKFYPRINYVKIVGYFLTHPKMTWSLTRSAARQAWSVAPETFGNLERSAGQPPRLQSPAFQIWSVAKRRLGPVGDVAALLLACASAAAAALVWRRGAADVRTRRYCAMYVWIAAMAFLQFPINVFTQGLVDIQRRLFVFNVLTDVLICVNTIWLAAAWAGRQVPSKRADQLAAKAPGA